jgi:acetyl esterase/lipase
LDDKSGNLGQRTYVAEQGYVVASIEYRTVNNGATYKDSVADVKSAIRTCARTPASTTSTRARSRCGDNPRAATSPR